MMDEKSRIIIKPKINSTRKEVKFLERKEEEKCIVLTWGEFVGLVIGKIDFEETQKFTL